MGIADRILNRLADIAEDNRADADRIAAELIDNRYDPIGEPMAAPDDGFDLGPTVDDTNLSDAGGYPANVPPYSPQGETAGLYPSPVAATTPAPCGCSKPATKRTEWRSIRYTFAATDTTPVAASPIGLGAYEVESATLVASVAGFRVGPTSNDAQAGAFLPAGIPLILFAGPLWIVSGGTVGTVDVFLELRVDA